MSNTQKYQQHFADHWWYPVPPTNDTLRKWYVDIAEVILLNCRGSNEPRNWTLKLNGLWLIRIDGQHIETLVCIHTLSHSVRHVKGCEGLIDH